MWHTAFAVCMIYMIRVICIGFISCILVFSRAPFNYKRHWLIAADAHILGLHAITRANGDPRFNHRAVHSFQYQLLFARFQPIVDLVMHRGFLGFHSPVDPFDLRSRLAAVERHVQHIIHAFGPS